MLSSRARFGAALLAFVLSGFVATFLFGCAGQRGEPDWDWQRVAYGNFGVIRVHIPTGTCVLFHGDATVLPTEVCQSYTKEMSR